MIKQQPIFLLLLTCVILSGCFGKEKELRITNERPISDSIKMNNAGGFKIGNPYKIAGKRYVPKETYSYSQTGIASWYGSQFHGKKTANGEIYDMNDLTAAHKTLQIPSIVRVTNLENGRSLIVRINDRGPFKRGRIIDMSKRGAELLQFKDQGTARVKVQVLSEESRAVAKVARRGQSTHGVEIAMNDPVSTSSLSRAREPITNLQQQPPAHRRIASTQIADAGQAMLPPVDTAANASLTPIDMQPLNPPPSPPSATSVPTQTSAPPPIKSFNNPIVRQLPVTPNSIYVQAGSFSEQANASRYAHSLEHFGQVDVYPAVVNGKQYFRVRFGPMQDVSQADTVLAKLADAGSSDAIIIVD